MSHAPVNGPLCTRDSLAADLATLGVRPGDTLLVHTSLSALGWVNGGAVALVQALMDALGPDGTLTVPAFTADNSDPSGWSAPPVPPEWWDEIRRTLPAYDPAVTRTRGIGVVPEVVRNWPGAHRSSHPQTSFAAVGRRAAELTAGHTTAGRLGDASPLARLEEAGAADPAARHRLRPLHRLPPRRVPDPHPGRGDRFLGADAERPEVAHGA